MYNSNDYQALDDLQKSHWWKLIQDELKDNIKDLEDVLLNPNLDEIFEDDKDRLEKEIKLLKYKKMERAYLIELLDLPKDLLSTKYIDK